MVNFIIGAAFSILFSYVLWISGVLLWDWIKEAISDIRGDLGCGWLFTLTIPFLINYLAFVAFVFYFWSHWFHPMCNFVKSML